MSELVKSRVRILLPHSLDRNIYIRELGQAYRTVGTELIYGVDNLFENTVQADLLHLHWPEAFYRWIGGGAVEARAERFIAAIDVSKANGTKLVWTIHNLTPHEHPNDKLDHDVYQQVLDRADLLIHHCPRSSTLLAERYRLPNHVAEIVVPHGHYLSYPHGITRDEARARLDIPASAYVYLQFGAIRGYKGIGTLFDAWRRVRHPNKWLLIAGQYQPPTGRYAWREKLHMLWARHADKVTLHLQNIAPEDIQSYLAAADCMVLTHAKGLNSGVAVLAMTFGLPVIGPRLGCIEWVLDAGINLAYETGDFRALVEAMERAPSLDAASVSATNRAVSASWRWDDMARAVLDHPAMCPATTP